MIDDVQNMLKVKRGNDLPQSKLNEKLVTQIRQRHKRAREIAAANTAKALAKEYGVHHRTIEKVLSGESWRYVD